MQMLGRPNVRQAEVQDTGVVSSVQLRSRNLIFSTNFYGTVDSTDICFITSVASTTNKCWCVCSYTVHSMLAPSVPSLSSSY